MHELELASCFIQNSTNLRRFFVILFAHQKSKGNERIGDLSTNETVISSASVDLNASLDPVNVFVKIDNHSEEDRLR